MSQKNSKRSLSPEDFTKYGHDGILSQSNRYDSVPLMPADTKTYNSKSMVDL